MRPFLVEFFGERYNLAISLDQFDGLLLQLIESFHGLLLGEILSKGSHQRVIIHHQRPVMGVEAGEFVNENPGVLINHEHFERLPKKHVFDERRLVGRSRLLVELWYSPDSDRFP